MNENEFKVRDHTVVVINPERKPYVVINMMKLIGGIDVALKEEKREANKC